MACSFPFFMTIIWFVLVCSVSDCFGLGGSVWFGLEWFGMVWALFIFVQHPLMGFSEIIKMCKSGERLEGIGRDYIIGNYAVSKVYAMFISMLWNLYLPDIQLGQALF